MAGNKYPLNPAGTHSSRYAFSPGPVVGSVDEVRDKIRRLVLTTSVVNFRTTIAQTKVLVLGGVQMDEFIDKAVQAAVEFLPSLESWDVDALRGLPNTPDTDIGEFVKVLLDYHANPDTVVMAGASGVDLFQIAKEAKRVNNQMREKVVYAMGKIKLQYVQLPQKTTTRWDINNSQWVRYEYDTLANSEEILRAYTRSKSKK